MDIKFKFLFTTLFLTILSSPAHAYLTACQLVAENAGKSYQAKPSRFASIVPPKELPESMRTTLIERNGMWFIYQTNEEQFDKSECAPKTRDGIEIVPVVYNKTSGHNAVVNGVFAIKTFNEKDIHLVANNYNFKKITQLPNRFTAIFDVKPQSSYDELIKKLQQDKDIEKHIPLLSEPRYKTR